MAILLVGVGVVGGSLLNKDSSVSADNTVDDNLNIVRVQGKGTINAEPDIAYVSLSVKTENKDVKKAQNENKKIMNKVIAELKKLDIAEKNIQTTDYNIYENYDWKNDERVFDAYVVRNSINVKVEDISKAGLVLDKSIEAGANVANGISFDIKDKEKVYNDALKLAMESAESKATAIMSTFGLKPTKPFRVDENGGYSPQFRVMFNAKQRNYDDAAVEEAGTSIQGGSLSVTAIVSVEYAY